MDYTRFHFKITPFNEAFADVLADLLGSIGFDSFENDGEMLTGYVQTTLTDTSSVDEIIRTFPVDGIAISYTHEQIPSEDWNAAWESTFEPISIGTLAFIHDSRTPRNPDVTYDIIINPHMAFGSGSHETTRMMLTLLLTNSNATNKEAETGNTPTDAVHSKSHTPRTALDVGCGTGILGIAALMSGCNRLTAIDIDSDSVKNTIENLAANQFYNQEVIEGDISIIPASALYDIILANIHLNIHLEQMESYVSHLTSGGILFLSGFFSNETDNIIKSGQSHGLSFVRKMEENGWAAVMLQKP